MSKENYVLTRHKLFDNTSQRLVALERNEYVKYRGVLNDQHLNWKHRIDHFASRINKSFGIIARLRHNVPFWLVESYRDCQDARRKQWKVCNRFPIV